MQDLVAIATEIAAKLVERKQTIAVAESSTGGLISAALLSVPGASGYFLGGAVVYTRDARRILMDIPDDAMKRHRLGVGALRKVAGEPDPHAFCDGLGPLGDRRDGTHRQPLRRCRRP